MLTFPLDKQDAPDAAELLVNVEVWPREHYERMFRQVLGDPNLTEESAQSVKAALEEAVAARYRLFSRRKKKYPDVTSATDCKLSHPCRSLW